MSRKVIILDVAKPDYREIKSYVKDQFGETVWNEANQEFKTTISNIGSNPEAGKVIEELNDLGEGNFRLRLVRQSRIVYEYDDKFLYVIIIDKRDKVYK